MYITVHHVLYKMKNKDVCILCMVYILYNVCTMACRISPLLSCLVAVLVYSLQVLNEQGKQVFFVVEATDMCTRQAKAERE